MQRLPQLPLAKYQGLLSGIFGADAIIGILDADKRPIWQNDAAGHHDLAAWIPMSIHPTPAAPDPGCAYRAVGTGGDSRFAYRLSSDDDPVLG